MVTKNDIKLVRSLQRKKVRDAQGLFIVEGEKPVMEALDAGAEVEALFWRSDCDHTKRFLSGPWRGGEVSAKEMEQMSGLSSSSPAVAVVKQQSQKLELDHVAQQRVLVLDALRDPGNLGTIIRSADWFGIRTILASKDAVDRYNPKVVQATMGSLFRVAVHYVSLTEVLRDLKKEKSDFEIIGAVLDGLSSRTLSSFEGSGALVIGNESNGVSPEVQALFSARMTIPRIGGAESLNAAVSASVLLYEWMVNPQS